MIHRAAIIEVLFETDCPEIVLARDGAGASYLSVLSERTPAGDRFLCVAVSARRLVEFRRGAIDLRDLLTKHETIAYVGEFRRDGETQFLHLDPLVEMREDWLPEAGFLLDNPDEATKGPMHLEVRANESGGFAGVLRLNPPEAVDASRISTYHLATGLRLFQDLIGYAGAKVVSGVADKTQKAIAALESFELHVLPEFQPGSFEVHLESTPESSTDLFGKTLIGDALKKIDEITTYINDPEAGMEAYRLNAGHLIRAYQAMLRFIVTENIPLTYSWADPGTREVSRPITVGAAQRTYDFLMATNELTAVEVVHVGKFVDLGKTSGGRWALDVGKRTNVRGTLIEGKPTLLQDVHFDSSTYRLVCDERIEENTATGKTKKVFVLKEKPVPV